MQLVNQRETISNQTVINFVQKENSLPPEVGLNGNCWALLMDSSLLDC